jgi:hypothetical protein
MAEVKFAVDVTEHQGTYGVTLWVDNSEQPDYTPAYRAVLKGKAGTDLIQMAQLWGACHRDAMDSVGLDGVVTYEEYEEKLFASVVLAGELMVRHEYEALAHDQVPEEVLGWLFMTSESKDN